LENVDKFYGHLEYVLFGHLGYFMTIGYILCSFGTFFRFWYHVSKKSGNLDTELRRKVNKALNLKGKVAKYILIDTLEESYSFITKSR
jgi:hypothetical protein